MKAAFLTLGCKVNQYETEVMAEQLRANGFEIVPAEHAPDVLVLNSCTVTEESSRRARQLLRRYRRLLPDAVLVLTGCMPQAFPKEAEALSEADIVLGNTRRAELLPAVVEFLSRRERILRIAPHEAGEAFERSVISGFSGHTRAFLKIEDGCNRFCSYCIIPYARGRVRSKPMEDIRREASLLAGMGFREIVLVGINLSAFGSERGETLVDAVEEVSRVEGISRIRLGSLEPDLLTGEVIARFSRIPAFCPQFHLSLQSGCDETLRRMNRRYDAAFYRGIVESIRASFENPAVTTDIMVGFPGETEEEFCASLRFAEEIAFAKAHVFSYSVRPGTRAADLEGQVPAHVKAERSRRMIELTARTRLAFLRAQEGRVCSVLFEQPAEDGTLEGYTENYTPVRVPAPETLCGQTADVRITFAEDDFCRGELA